MFLVLGVLGNEKCEALVDATLLEEPLELLLEVKIKRVELEGTRCECARSTGDEVKKKNAGSHLRTDVETAAFPVRLRGEVRRQLSILVE